MALATVVRKTAKLAPCFRMFATKSEAEVSLSSILTQSLDAQVADVTDVSGETARDAASNFRAHFVARRRLWIDVQGACCVTKV